MRLGIVVGPDDLAKAARVGLSTCEVSVGADQPLTAERAARLSGDAAAHGLEITSIWTHCRRGQVWNVVEGPTAIGLVPEAIRHAGVARPKEGADSARAVGVGSITTDAGFIPENPNDPVYRAVVAALGELAAHCRAQGQDLCLETGQETPVTLLRTIEDVGAAAELCGTSDHLLEICRAFTGHRTWLPEAKWLCG